MDSRLSEVYNKRAAELSMIPGNWYGIPMNKYEGGEPAIAASICGPAVKKITTNMNLVPTNSELADMRNTVITQYTTKPYEMATTFTGTLGAEKLNSKFTKAKKSDLPDENFDIIGSEKYPEPPVLWQTSIGAPSRLFGRTDGKRYTR